MMRDLTVYRPEPASHRKPFQMDVPVGRKQVGLRSEKVTVHALETCSEYLVIHPTTTRGMYGWSITHVPTGYTILDYIPQKRRAWYIAGVIAAIFDCSEDHSAGFGRQLESLDAKVGEWFDYWLARMHEFRPKLPVPSGL